MKKLLFKLFLAYFKKELKSQISMALKDHKKQQEIESTRINYPIGKKVIIRSNEPNDLVVGTVVGYEQFNTKLLLLIEDCKTKEIIMPLDNQPAIYYKERYDALLKLNWAEQWNVMSKNHYFIDAKTFKYKESDAYKNR